MPNIPTYRIKTISELHKMRGLPTPEHPLISVLKIRPPSDTTPYEPVNLIADFYIIAFKKNYNTKVKIKYGHQQYDHEEGVLIFMSPGQVFSVEYEPPQENELCGWVLLVHPDFLWNTSLAKKIRQYEFFGYSIHEALFLSEKEEATITQFIHNIEQEYHSNLDQFSQHIIISQLESLLNYSERFYGRQFLTRRVTNHRVLDRLEELLNRYFDEDEAPRHELPSVNYVAEQLNVSPDYLSGLLKSLTGLNTQQHIHEKLIEKAKEKLSTTNLSVSEIAYQLGFGHPQSFSKLFKSKVRISPLQFRQSFN